MRRWSLSRQIGFVSALLERIEPGEFLEEDHAGTFGISLVVGWTGESVDEAEFLRAKEAFVKPLRASWRRTGPRRLGVPQAHGRVTAAPFAPARPQCCSMRRRTSTVMPLYASHSWSPRCTRATALRRRRRTRTPRARRPWRRAGDDVHSSGTCTGSWLKTAHRLGRDHRASSFASTTSLFHGARGTPPRRWADPLRDTTASSRRLSPGVSRGEEPSSVIA